jgi:acyl dehydratase
MNKIRVGDRFDTRFSLNRDEVDEFRRLSGDTNQIHYSADAASKSAIGAQAVRSVHGMHAALIFTRILGTQFPGDGTVYRSLTIEFEEPIFIQTEYVAEVSVLSVDRKRHRARLLTVIRDLSEPDKTRLFGTALVIHEDKF